MKELLDSATAGGNAVTHDGAAYTFPLGGTMVTWTEWDGAPGTSNIVSTTSAYVYVFRFGETPVGETHDERAIAGNHAPKVARDASGKIHVVWCDCIKTGAGKVFYRRASQNQNTGAITWETGPIQVDSGTATSRSHPAITASPNAVHVVWYESGQDYYRRIIRSGTTWTIEPTQAITGVTSSRSNNGMDIYASSDTEVHIASIDMKYAHTTNADGPAVTWTVESIPVSGSTPSMAVDTQGGVHIVYTKSIRGSKYGAWRTDVPNAGYWQIWYLYRNPSGVWNTGEDALASFPEWGDPQADADPLNDDWDVLTDWIDIDIAEDDHIHVGWHGSVNTHIFGNDQAFYMRRPSTGPGTWGAWQNYQELHPINVSLDQYFSWCPPICVDAPSKLAITVPFYNTFPLESDFGYQSVFEALRNGVLEGDSVELSRASEQSMATWDTCTGARIFRHPNGRGWLDVLQDEMTPAADASPYIITYQHYEVTSLLPGPNASVTSAVLSGTVADQNIPPTITINGVSRPVDTGAWTSQDIALLDGSPVTIQAVDASGNSRTVTVTIDIKWPVH
jgi:hypothetical protein